MCEIALQHPFITFHKVASKNKCKSKNTSIDVRCSRGASFFIIVLDKK